MNALTRTVVAALLLAVPVVAETVHLVDDEGPGHAVFGLTQLAGWALLLTVCRALSRDVGAGRWGPRLVVAGVGGQLLFAVLYVATWAASGEPSEAVWPVFLLGFLALTVGGLLWARRLRTAGEPTAAAGLAAVAVLGFLAMAIGQDPFHDVALVGSYLAWVVVGHGAARRRVSPVAGRTGELRGAAGR